MSDEIKTQSQTPENKSQEIALDDARRVKVLSPSMLVFKRFIRNKLAIIGLVILVFMFIFSFAGGLFTPYGQSEVFKGTQTIPKDYAGATFNDELRYIVKTGMEFPNSARSKFILAVNKGLLTFDSGDSLYGYSMEGDNFYKIYALVPKVTALLLAGQYAYNDPDGVLTADLQTAFETAISSGMDSFELNGAEYVVQKAGKAYNLCVSEDLALASLMVMDAYDNANSNAINSYEFRYASEKAISDAITSFTFDGNTFTLSTEEEKTIIYDASGAAYAGISNIIVNPSSSDEVLTAAFKDSVREAIADDTDRFVYEDETYFVDDVNSNYYITRNTETLLIRVNESPSSEHLLGLDGNGMDVLTRLMYGGRISLMVGFVVIFIELFIGIIFGGIAGYFGGVIDNILMRFVDLFNSIPFWPLCFIVGSVMDTLDMNPKFRIFILMILLGVLGWTGIARVVRGQILTLREQDFMVATEATGIRVNRRIFRHLVPNVMPLLIVQATMGLGGIIITEATLSFLGLGVKYPLASWGNIINAATDIYVMTNYWFIWMPAGLLILLAVLGFNFVGDGLRDAFDPKMKR